MRHSTVTTHHGGPLEAGRGVRIVSSRLGTIAEQQRGKSEVQRLWCAGRAVASARACGRWAQFVVQAISLDRRLGLVITLGVNASVPGDEVAGRFRLSTRVESQYEGD